MVTLAYFIMIFLLTLLVALFDMYIFQFSLPEALRNLYNSEVFIGRLFTVLGAVIGLGFSLVTDFRIVKDKKKGRLNKGS